MFEAATNQLANVPRDRWDANQQKRNTKPTTTTKPKSKVTPQGKVNSHQTKNTSKQSAKKTETFTPETGTYQLTQKAM